MPSGDGRRFTGGEARGTRQKENERTHARTHAARTERGGAEVNASRSPKFLGQPVVRATRSTELVDPRRWVVVAPVTSIPAEALQSKRPMPKTHTTRELSLSPTSSSRYPNARQFQRDSHSFSIFSVRPSHRISTEDGFWRRRSFLFKNSPTRFSKNWKLLSATEKGKISWEGEIERYRKNR